MAVEPAPMLKGAVDLLIMQALAAGPTHGYGVMRWIEQTTGAAIQLEEGSLYPALYRLEDRKLVESEFGISENNRRARFYRLSKLGRARLKSDSSDFIRFARAMLVALDAPVPAPAR